MRTLHTLVLGPLLGTLHWPPIQLARSSVVLVRLDVPSQRSLKPGERRTIGSCIVEHMGKSITLERSSEPGNVQSEWDVSQGCAPDYAGCIAEMALKALASRPQRGGRVLMLGLGGGSIAGHILCGSTSIDWTLRVTAVEADGDVVTAAQELFFPSMFGENPRVDPAAEPNLRQRLRVLHADAERVADGSVTLGDTSRPFDVIIEDFAYGSYGALGVPFWRSLRERHAAPDATVLINTLYSHFTEMEHLARDLRKAGWTNVRQRVNRGLQASDGERKVVAPAEWRPGDNMIVSALNRGRS